MVKGVFNSEFGFQPENKLKVKKRNGEKTEVVWL